VSAAMSDFDERSGVVRIPAPWGWWEQTNDDVVVVVQCADPPLASARSVRVAITPRSLAVHRDGSVLVEVGEGGLMWSSSCLTPARRPPTP
jgi:hypothetical protein